MRDFLIRIKILKKNFCVCPEASPTFSKITLFLLFSTEIKHLSTLLCNETVKRNKSLVGVRKLCLSRCLMYFKTMLYPIYDN